LDGIGGGRRSQAERQRQFALRAVAGTGLDDLPLPASRRVNPDASPYPVAIAFRPANCLKLQSMIRTGVLVSVQVCRSAIRGHEDIHGATIPNVAIRGSASDHRAIQSGLRGNVLEAAVSQVVE